MPKLTTRYGFIELTKIVWSFLLEKKLSAKENNNNLEHLYSKRCFNLIHLSDTSTGWWLFFPFWPAGRRLLCLYVHSKAVISHYISVGWLWLRRKNFTKNVAGRWWMSMLWQNTRFVSGFTLLHDFVITFRANMSNEILNFLCTKSGKVGQEPIISW